MQPIPSGLLASPPLACAVRFNTTLLVWLWLIAAGGHADAPSDTSSTRPTQPAVLHLGSGDVLAGALSDCPVADTLRWQHPDFVGTFEFPRAHVRRIQFPRRAEPSRREGDYLVELAGGDVVFGFLRSITADEVELELPRRGVFRLQRSLISRLVRRADQSDLVYLGPDGLDGWEGTKPEWREEAGHWVTDHPNAFLFGNLGIPSRACIEFAISWAQKPDFVLAVGVNDAEEPAPSSFRFEVWNDDLVVVGESRQEADVAALIALTPGTARVHLLAYLDQVNQRLIVCSPNGKQLADLRLTDRGWQPRSGIRLANKRGDIRWERLRVSHWNGVPPTEMKALQSAVRLTDGRIVYGQVEAFDSAAREFIVAAERQKSRVAEAQVQELILAPAPPLLPPDSVKIRVVLQDGVRLSGELVRVTDGQLWLRHPVAREILPLPLQMLASLTVLDQKFSSADSPHRLGRLELEQTRLHGTCEDGERSGEASCLVWHPKGSRTAAALRAGAAGRIVYRDPPRALPTPRPQAIRPGGGRPDAVGGVLQWRIATAQASSTPIPSGPFQPTLHLRTGDAIPCSIVRIDERGVTFETPLSVATFAAHDQIKAVELARGSDVVPVDEAKRERLLTLPRMQRQSPPTHLIRSTSGDYLRGRLTELSDQWLTIEVRLDTLRLPREAVSQIVWLHAEELEPAQTRNNPEATCRVQAVRSNGTRLTLDAEELRGSQLIGVSEVLGTCRIDLHEVDQLLLGHAIEAAASQFAYQAWRLRHAQDPKFVTAGDAAAAGAESALVGQRAPDFELDLLDGTRFRLLEQRGKVLVLDFWASWCGPCMQTMPTVEALVRDFANEGVELIAVNLQESTSEVQAALDRLGLHIKVALDLDGVVAERYAASAIPQTVIIRRDGTVAWLFVGGGPQFSEQLRAALQQTLQE